MYELSYSDYIVFDVHMEKKQRSSQRMKKKRNVREISKLIRIIA